VDTPSTPYGPSTPIVPPGYQNSRYLGTLHAQPNIDGQRHVQPEREAHILLGDAVRALCRPVPWPDAPAPDDRRPTTATAYAGGLLSAPGYSFSTYRRPTSPWDSA